MNETLRIRIEVDGKLVPVSKCSEDAVLLNNENSPRALALGLKPADRMTEYRLRRVRTLLDWPPDQFSVKLGVDGGELVCSGVDVQGLPFGNYTVHLKVDELQDTKAAGVEIPENGSGVVTAKFRADSRDIKLTVPVEQFDERIKTVLLHPQSQLDGLAIPDWLNGPAKPQRKACLLNVMCKARAAIGPTKGTYLIDSIRSILHAEADRIYVSASPDLHSSLQALAEDPKKPFYDEKEPKAPIHRRLLDQIGPGGLNLEPNAQRFLLQSFRQEGTCCMQAVIARPPDHTPARAHYADLDIDLGNPLQDLCGLFTHFGEVICPGKTDHLGMATTLAKGDTGKFLYYKVVRVR